jgi:hypothetical protein
MSEQILHDLLALQVLAPLSATYLPWNVAAMRPSGVVAVLNEVTINRRRCIVELGSGISTLYLGRLLRRQGGHLWTVEHDGPWADLIAGQLADEALGDVVTLVRAPLIPAASPAVWPGETDLWYDPVAVRDGVPDRPIDLLVIDGPPASDAARQHARYPAVPFFAPFLAADHAIVLDDFDRPGEQDIVKRWEQDLDRTFERQILAGGTGICRTRSSFTV